MAQLADTSTGRDSIGINEPVIRDALLRAGKVSLDRNTAKSAQKRAILVIYGHPVTLFGNTLFAFP